MPTSIEAQGLTIDEAIQLALNQLGVGRDRVEIEIVHHPRSGFLGIGSRRAKVRATVRERVMEDGEEFDMAGGDRRSRGRRRRRSARRRGGERPRADGGGEDKERRRDTQRGGAKTQPRDGGRDRGGQRPREGNKPQPRGDGGRQQQKPRRAEGRQQQSPRQGSRGRRQGESKPRNGERPSPPLPSGAADARVVPPQPAQPAAPTRRLSADDVRERAQSLVADVMRMMGIAASVEARSGPAHDEVTVHVKAEAEGLLIGRRGQTLDALEHLINRMVVPRDAVTDIRVGIDVGGYRDRRRQSLVALAARLKARALHERRQVQVSPMNARDRATFEDALAGDETVETRVLGSGVYRRVLLAPVDVGEQGSPVEAIESDAATGEVVEQDEPAAEAGETVQAEATREAPGTVPGDDRGGDSAQPVPATPSKEGGSG